MDRAEMNKDPTVVIINTLRTEVKETAATVRELTDAAKGVGNERITPRSGEDRPEMIANLMLAYRHLEDASMRLGKAIQARDGGTSVYDKSTTVGA